MPDLTLTLTDDDLAHLAQLGAELGLTAKRMAERIVHRGLTKTSKTPPVSNMQRAADRAHRQLEITKRIGRRKKPTLSMAERAALALQFGTSIRTITRDLEVAQRALKKERPQKIAS